MTSEIINYMSFKKYSLVSASKEYYTLKQKILIIKSMEASYY